MYQTWNFLPSLGTPSPTTTLAPGNHEFPFTFCLSNTTPDTIEGLDDCYVKYQLKATMGTAGGRRIEADTRVRVRRMYRSLLLPEPKVSYYTILSFSLSITRADFKRWCKIYGHRR